MKHYSTIKQISKLSKLKRLTQNSTLPEKPILYGKFENQVKRFGIKSVLNLSKELSLYLSLTEKPLNLLFSIDQFFFEFSKKNYQQRKTGEFLSQLKERKKLSIFYGYLTRRQLVNLFSKVKKTRGNLSKNVLCLLERRLDVVLYRSGITRTVAQARQLIKHKKILVNQNLVNIPSLLLNAGDIISPSPETLWSLKKRKFYKVIPQKSGNFEIKLKNQHTFFSPIFQDFFSKLSKIRENSLNIKNSCEKKISLKKKDHPLKISLITKLFCEFLVQVLCTRIKSRSDLKIKKNATNPHALLEKGYTSVNSRFDSTQLKELRTHTEKNVLIMLKIKVFSAKKNSGNHSLLKNKNQKHTFVYTTQRFLQKKPLFWFLNSVAITDKKRPFLYSFSSGNHPKNQSPGCNWYLNHKKFFKNGEGKNQNLIFFRQSFLFFFSLLENHTKLKTFLTLNTKKLFLKKKNVNLSRILRFRALKPLHLEVSYILFNIIYLYSPQRLNYPFFIDIDLINRSLC